MIDEKELRRGNYVLHAGKVETVCWIHMKCVKLNDYADEYKYENTDPIPLTP
jgi:hypothetical protein